MLLSIKGLFRNQSLIPTNQKCLQPQTRKQQKLRIVNQSYPLNGNGIFNSSSSKTTKTRVKQKHQTIALPAPPKSAKFIEVVVYLAKLCFSQRNFWKRVLLSLTCMLIAKTAGLSAPFYFKKAVDTLWQTGAMSEVFWRSSAVGILLLFGICRIMNGVIKEFQYPLFLPVAQSISRRLAYQTFSHVLGLDVGFHLDQSSGRLSRVLERGVRAIQQLFRSIVFTLIPTFIELIMVSFLLTKRFNFVTGAGVLVTFIAYIAWTTYMISKTTQARNLAIELDNRTTSKAVDALLNFQTVKMFDNSQLEVTQYDEYLKGYQDANVTINNLSASLNAGQSLILNIGLTAMLCIASVNGNVTPGDLVLIQGLLLQLWTPLQFLGWFYRELRNSLIDMGGVFELLRRDPVADGHLELPSNIKGMLVEVENLRFSYQFQNREVLKGVSLRVKPGEKVAIVGQSGSGKSTILKMLVRLHEPNEGQVLLEDIPITQLKQSSFKKQVAVVPQDTVLFNDTICENIRYGRPEASDEEVIEAAEMARLHKAIKMMPQQYDTVVGERGLKLSGGEKQRVAIARAFLRKPRLLICDEATSALDSGTEFQIMQQLNELAEGRTSIFVAHRLSTIQNCDRILVMAEGKIVEEGTHSELIARGQIYRDMWSMQSDEDAQHFHDDVPLAPVLQ